MTTEQSEFRFLDPGPLVDGDLELVLAWAKPCDTRRGVVPQYEFELRLAGTTLKIGLIKLRIRLTEELKQFGGNLSYDVDDGYRGGQVRGTRMPVAFPAGPTTRAYEPVDNLRPDNAASRRTCELIGARYVDTIEAEIEPGKHRPTCRFVASLEDAKAH